MCIQHILVVDDEPELTESYKEYFEFSGYKVTVAYDGQAALDISRSTPVDAVITDFRMPLMNGQELLQSMRQTRPGLPVIIISGNPGDFHQDEDVLTKVFIKPTRLPIIEKCVREMPCDVRSYN